MPVPFQARTERDLKRPGYCASSHMRTFLTYATSGHIHAGDEITAKRLDVELGIPRQEQYLVLAALRHLGFIDGGKHITSTLEELVHATGEDYQKKFIAVLEDSYPEIFHSGLDLAHATPVEVKKAFEACNFEPVNMQLKMVALFRSFCRMAGIVQSESATSQESNGHATSAQPSLLQVTTFEKLGGDAHMPTPSLNGSIQKQDYPIIEGLLDALEVLRQLPKNPGWTEANRQSWLKAITVNVNLLQAMLAGKEEK